MVTFRSSRLRKSSNLSVVKRLKCPFIRCDTSGCAMPKTSAISRCFNFSSFRILKTWYPICARARSWSASLRPRSANTFPEPSSNSISFRFFILVCRRFSSVLAALGFVAACRFAQRGNVGNVLRSSRRQFRRNQVFTRNERRRETALRVHHGFNPILPSVIKINAPNFREDVHDNGGAAHAEELVTLYEVFGCQSVERRAEFPQRGIDRPGVLGIWLDKQINVLGRPRLRVKRDRKS